MSASTNIPAGHPLARKVFGAAVFADLVAAPGFMKNMTGPAPQMGEATAKLSKMQTSAAYPFVRVTDLSKGDGDVVSVDLFNIIQGKPIIGDEQITGKLMSLKSSSQSFTLDQVRGGVETGGRMSQHRTVHDLRSVGRANLTGWYNRYYGQLALVHLCGARGDDESIDWVIPTAADADFTKICVNPVLAPTYDKHWYAGDATSLNDMDTADALTLDDIDRFRGLLDELVIRFPPVKFEGDDMAEEDPLYVLLLGTRTWHHLQTHQHTSSNDIRSWQAAARERGKSNPLFKGDAFMWNGFLVRRMPGRLAVRFNQGSSVTTATNAAEFATTSTTVATFDGGGAAADYTVERNLILGAQALGVAFGKDTASGTHFKWFEQKVDHDNAWEGSVSAIMGMQKLRFRNGTGVDSDHGVIAVDCYAPKPGIATTA